MNQPLLFFGEYLPIQLPYSYIAEINGLSLTLQGNESAIQQFAIYFYFGIVIIGDSTSYLWVCISQNGISVNDVSDHVTAPND
jgi:hypothetical protein